MSSESESDEADGPLYGLDPATAGPLARIQDPRRRRLHLLCSAASLARALTPSTCCGCARSRLLAAIRYCWLAPHVTPALDVSGADALDLRDRFSDLATAGRLNEALALVRAVVRADRSDVLTRCAWLAAAPSTQL